MYSMDVVVGEATGQPAAVAAPVVVVADSTGLLPVSVEPIAVLSLPSQTDLYNSK